MNGPRAIVRRVRGKQDESDEAVDLAAMVLASRTALLSLRSLVTARKVPVNHLSGHAWGQWLDEPSHHKEHWGRFGTSAALQVLAIAHAEHGDGQDFEQLQAVHNVADLFPAQLADPPPVGEEDPLKLRDFQAPMKLAFCIDALSPNFTEIGGTRALVDRLLELQLPEDPGWSTRHEGDDLRTIHDRLLVTAFALLALRRLPNLHRRNDIVRAYRYLAESVAADRKLGPDVVALCGLALDGGQGDIADDNRVRAGLVECDALSAEWATDDRPLIIDRPYFRSYSDGENTDYMFLSPEIVVSLFLFQRRAGERPVAPFAIRVVEAVTESINGGHGHASGLRGFQVQNGQEGTVDQLWAARLLSVFLADQRRGRSTAVATATQGASTTPADTKAPLKVRLGIAGTGAIVVAAAALLAPGAPTIIAALLAVAAVVGGSPVVRLVKPFLDRRFGS